MDSVTITVTNEGDDVGKVLLAGWRSLPHSGKTLHITNNSKQAVEAINFTLVADGLPVLDCMRWNGLSTPLLQPGQSVEEGCPLPRINPSGEVITPAMHITVEIDSIAFADGTVEGPNIMGIDAWLRLRSEVAKGGPVYPSMAGTSRGGGPMSLYLLLERYKNEHPDAPLPRVIVDGQDRQISLGGGSGHFTEHLLRPKAR